MEPVLERTFDGSETITNSDVVRDDVSIGLAEQTNDVRDQLSSLEAENTGCILVRCEERAGDKPVARIAGLGKHAEALLSRIDENVPNRDQTLTNYLRQLGSVFRFQIARILSIVSRNPQSDTFEVRLPDELVINSNDGDVLGLRISVEQQSGGDAHEFLIRVQDISETVMRNVMKTLARKVSVLEEESRIDLLTGTPNKKALLERTTNALEEIKRYPNPKHQLATIFVDLDGFKAINDTYGHSVGDRVLVEVANKISGIIRAKGSDTYGRLSGDEQLILLKSITQEDAMNKAQEIRRAVENLEIDTGDGTTVTVTLSMGIAFADGTDNSLTAKELIDRADAGMYISKYQGGLQVAPNGNVTQNQKKNSVTVWQEGMVNPNRTCTNQEELTAALA